MGEEDLLQVIAPDGTIDGRRDPGLPEATLREAFRHLCLVRALDTRMLSLQRQGRIGFYVPSIGEEASQVGSAMALEPEDWVSPASREPGCALWRGVPLKPLVAQSYGNALDVMKGRQMPNHYGYRDIHYVTASSPVGTQIPQAVGAAMAARIREDPRPEGPCVRLRRGQGRRQRRPRRVRGDEGGRGQGPRGGRAHDDRGP